MRMTGCLSVMVARSCYGTASVIASRHVHVASSGHTVPAPVSSSSQIQQRHLQWRCRASSVKNMTGKQLKSKEEAAEAGADDPGANDHYDRVADTLKIDAVEDMGKALSNVQAALSNMTVRGIRPDQHACCELQR